MQNNEVVILAAGHGKRMQSDLPKALIPLGNSTLIEHVLEAVRASGIESVPIIVVGQKKEQVIEALGSTYRYAVQHEQLGTGNAVMSAEALLSPTATSVLVLYADHPYIAPETIRALLEARETSGSKIAMATVTLPDFDDWKSAFLGFSRVKRSPEGAIVGVVEAKDATEAEKTILEVNPAYFTFDKAWLLEELPKLKNQNAQAEYYLTDLVKMAFEEGLAVPSISISPREAIGANSKADLEIAEMVEKVAQ
jgi:bifunctional UDP-N-acetylglucosamine pyrophosphorylase/glucosamine-1-phosphate N-acetyltransferase